MSRQYPASGALFVNKRKAENDRAPDYNGRLEFDDEMIDYLIDARDRGEFGEKGYVEVELSAWVKKSSNGAKWLSLSAKKPWKPEGRSAPSRPSRPPNNPSSSRAKQEPLALDDDSIPF